MDSRNRRSFSGGSGNDVGGSGGGGGGGRGNNSTAYYNRSRSRFSRSRSRSRERNRGFGGGGGGGGGGGFRHRNSRSRSRDRSPVFRHDERGGRGGGGDPDLYHNLINDDCRDDQRNYNPRNNFNNRPFRREDNFEQNRNNRNNRDNDRGRDHQDNFDNDQRWRDFENRERNSMERSDRFQERDHGRESKRPWNRNFSNEHDDRGRSHERMSRPRDNRPNNNNGAGNNNSMSGNSRERERDWEHDRDQDWNHDRNLDRNQDRHQDRNRRGSSEDEMDEGQMRRNKNGSAQEPLNIIIILGLTMEITRADIMSELIKMNMEPACIRIIRKHGKRFCPDTAAQQQRNSSRGIAFVEFTTVEEAKQWMEITQGVLKLGEHRLTMQYSHTRIQDWNCSKCGVCNFKFRCYCFVCKTSREEAESLGGSEGVDEVSTILTKKIMLRNLDALTNEEGVLTALQQHLPDLTKTISKVLISRDTLTQASRGICYLQFDTLIDSMNVHNGLTALDPPLTLDDRPVAITYCIDGEEHQNTSKDSNTTANRTSEESHQSRDVAGGLPSGLGGSYTLADVPRLAEYSASLYASNPAEQAHYVQYYTDFYTAEISKKSGDPQLTEANSGAAVALSAIQRKQKKMNSIETTITAAATAAALAAAEVKASFAAQTAMMSAAPRGNDGKTYPTPDVSQYQYDETSGYYYDRTTGLYYDAHSQYYYNNETGAYLYWDQKRSTYVLATPASTQAALQEVLADAEQKEEDARKAKEKEKEKEGGGNKHDKVKVAKKIVKDMEKWAKQLNQKKDYTVVATPQPILSANDGPSTSRGSQGGYADLGFSILEKKERAKLTDFMPGPNKIVNAYGGGSDSEEEGGGNMQNAQTAMGAGPGSVDESDYVDFQKLTCQLCKRAFQSLDILQKHLKMSNLHKENLAKLNQNSGGAGTDEGLSYRDRAKERRLKYGESDPPPPNRSRERFEQEIKTLQTRQKDSSGPAAAMPISSSNVGSRLLQKMGWSEGQGLGRKNQGRTQIIEAEGRTNNVGLGNKAGNMIPGNDYKSYIKKMMKQRYENA